MHVNTTTAKQDYTYKGCYGNIVNEMGVLKRQGTACDFFSMNYYRDYSLALEDESEHPAPVFILLAYQN